MHPERRLAEKLLAEFTSVLRARLNIDGIEAEHEPSFGTGAADLILRIPVDGQSVKVVVEVKRNAFPRDIERARVQLQGLAREDMTIEQTMVWAESLSEGARKSLEDLGIGYFDSSGSISLKLQNHHILIDRPPIKPLWREVGTIFTPERARVLHSLLLGWDKWRTGVELAKDSRASPNTVSVLLRELEKRGMVQSEGSGRNVRRQLVQPDALLDAWANHWAEGKRRKTRWFAFAQNPGNLALRLVSRLLRDHDEWAFTGQYAANCVTPLLTAVNGFDIIVPVGMTEAFAEDLELKRADKGFNVTLHECEDFALQHRIEVPGRQGLFASAVIQYLELANEGGRSKELANELKQTWIVKGGNHG